MHNLELSKALALSIGYRDCDVRLKLILDFSKEYYQIEVHRHESSKLYGPAEFGVWKRFDYRDWSVIGPIATKYNCFPSEYNENKWFAHVCGPYEHASTPQEAIALAVINRPKLYE